MSPQLSEPPPSGDQGAGENLTTASSKALPITPRNERLVSSVADAFSATTQHYDPKHIIEAIREGKPFELRERILKIRNTFASVMKSTGGDRKAAKKAVSPLKLQLSGVMWSGKFRNRKSDNPDGMEQHSGLLCADLDNLGERIDEIREKLKSSRYLWALFTSPTGDGLKALFRVPAEQ